MTIKQTEYKSPVEIVSDRLDEYKYVVIPSNAIGCISPKWHSDKVSEGLREDVVDLTVKIEYIRGAQKVLIVEE